MIHKLKLTNHRIERVSELMRNSCIDHRMELVLSLDVIIEQFVRDVNYLQNMSTFVIIITTVFIF